MHALGEWVLIEIKQETRSSGGLHLPGSGIIRKVVHSVGIDVPTNFVSKGTEVVVLEGKSVPMPDNDNFEYVHYKHVVCTK